MPGEMAAALAECAESAGVRIRPGLQSALCTIVSYAGTVGN